MGCLPDPLEIVSGHSRLVAGQPPKVPRDPMFDALERRNWQRNPFVRVRAHKGTLGRSDA